MDYLLFIGYLFLFSWLVTRLPFFKASELNNSQLIILFLLKVIAGIFYGWVGIYYGYFAYMYDTWGYHNTSVDELQLLYDNPRLFFRSLFVSDYEHGYSGLFASSNSFWNDLKGNLFIKMLSLFDILSFGNYYINVIFYNFLTLSGPVMIYRILTDIYPRKKTVLLIGVFLLPSFLYWTSGIHKDGLTLTALSLVLFHFYFGWKQDRFGLGRILWILLGLLILLALRNYVLALLLPALLAWGISRKVRKHPIRIFLLVYLISGIAFFTLKYIHPALDLPTAVSAKQAAYMKLEGGSGLKVTPLEPSLTGFLHNAPEAFVNSLMRPFPADIKHMLSLGVFAENVAILLIVLFFFFYRDKNAAFNHPFILTCYFLGFSLLMTVGYTICFQGAIARYRSPILPLIVAPFLLGIDWNRVKSKIFSNIKK